MLLRNCLIWRICLIDEDDEVVGEELEEGRRRLNFIVVGFFKIFDCRGFGIELNWFS